MFMGEYQHSLDEKSRLIIPARFREDLGERFVLTRGLDRSLFLYPLAEWKAIEEKDEDPFDHPGGCQSLCPPVFSGAVECEPDKQGGSPSRLTSASMRVSKGSVYFRVSTRIEIWAREVWEEYAKKAEESTNRWRRRLLGLGSEPAFRFLSANNQGGKTVIWTLLFIFQFYPEKS